MDENTFWLRLWQSCLAVVAVFVLTVGGCDSYATKRIADAIDKGASPMDVRCAIGGTDHRSGICALRASK
jgi:hypothetical protein